MGCPAIVEILTVSLFLHVHRNNAYFHETVYCIIIINFVNTSSS